MTTQTAFFIAGKALLPGAPSYVTRPADRDLLDRVLEGEFCYVLTARQMGKSSLMLRTAQALQDRQVKTVLIDLTTIHTALADEWYPSVLIPIKDRLNLHVDVRAWWNEHQDLSPSQRLIDFLHDVVLQQTRGSIAIFIDEIDTTLALNFRDDFFAAIRAVYNLRASDPAYKRLTFVLLGVATPTDLIQDRNRTPFNIGHKIVLQEFSLAEAAPLRQGLEERHGRNGARILERIFYWTRGHPYLTQKLCLVAVHTSMLSWDDQKVDELVASTFFSRSERDDANLIFVRDRIRETPTSEQRRMLKLYNAVYTKEDTPDDERSATQIYLELLGLVGVEKGKLYVRNRIYRHVFNQDWIKATMPQNQRLLVTVASGILGLIGLSLVVIIAGSFGGWFPPPPPSTPTTASALVPTSPPTLQPVATDTPTLLPASTAVVVPSSTATDAPLPPSPTATEAPLPTPTPTPAITPTPIPTCQVARVVSMRSGPGRNFPLVPQSDLSSGTTVSLLGRNPNPRWVKIEVPGNTVGAVKQGWVAQEGYLEGCTIDLDSLPVVR